MKAYILSFDELTPSGLFGSFNPKTFHNQLTTAEGLLNWWYYLKDSYILIVEDTANATTISEFVRSIAPNKHFLVVHLDLRDHNGWLPQEAWTWINQQMNRVN